MSPYPLNVLLEIVNLLLPAGLSQLRDYLFVLSLEPLGQLSLLQQVLLSKLVETKQITFYLQIYLLHRGMRGGEGREREREGGDGESEEGREGEREGVRERGREREGGRV